MRMAFEAFDYRQTSLGATSIGRREEFSLE